jgi:hypothetical protein
MVDLKEKMKVGLMVCLLVDNSVDLMECEKVPMQAEKKG